MQYWTSGATSIFNILIKILVSCSTIVIIYIICTKLKWSNVLDRFIKKCGIYSLSIYITHWTFINIGIRIAIFQNELIAFVITSTFAIIICIVCIQFKLIISHIPIADFLLFGNNKILKK